MPDLALFPIPPVGLVLRGEEPVPIPLAGVTVAATLKDFASRVVVSQRYRNQEAKPIEAVYVFPLEEGAAVCGFEAVVDGVHVVGEVRERDQAFADYDDALAAGHGAYLLDQERPDVFTASIGNVPPGGEVLVRITYVAELELAGDALRFALPTTVSPRYAPAADQSGVGKPPAVALNPPHAFRVPYGLELTVDLAMHAALRAVESPSHPISVELDGPRGHVRLGGRDAALDRDFVLNVRLAEEAAPWVRLERDGQGRSAAVLSLRPQIEAEEGASEIVFVVDRSGSMQGASIAEARNALQLCLRSLTPAARFNIVGFGSRFDKLFPESRPYDEASLAEARRHVETLAADLGGTEILAPLQAILDSPADPGRPRQLFVLTDGQVTNTEAALALARRHADTTRIFTFGIGAGASHHLVRGLARAGGGAAEFIAPGERLEGKVLRQLAKALTPALSEVALDWGGLAVTQAPHRLPPCFAGGRLLVYGLLDALPAAPVDVALRAHGPAGPVAWTLRLDPAAVEAGELVGTLAARALIRDLEEGSSPLHDRRGSLQDRGRGAARVKDEIVRLGVGYGLVSSHTSFVAIERRENATAGEAQLRQIPVALTSGWGGIEEQTGCFGGALTPAVAPAMMPRSPSRERGSVPIQASALPAGGAAAGPPLPLGLTKGGPPSSTRLLDLLVALQRADGSWDLSEDLSGVLMRHPDELRPLLAGATGDKAEAERALATALALHWLEAREAATRDEWALLAKKARRWLAACTARPAGGGGWEEMAAAVRL